MTAFAASGTMDGVDGSARRIGLATALAVATGCYVGPPDPAAETDEGGDTVVPAGDASSGESSAGSASGTSGSGSASNTGGTSAGSNTSDSDFSDGSAGTSAASDDSGESGATGGSTGDEGEPPPEGCTAEVAELVALVNAYRNDNGLPSIPLSPSLCIVGQSHAIDLFEEGPHEVANCNLHSWSNAGPWSACCYTPDHAEAQCMWDKPRELTDYPGSGYENSAFGTSTPAAALAAWQGSPPHNDVILNQGIWADRPWGAIGAGMLQGYAVLWFGEEADPAL